MTNYEINKETLAVICCGKQNSKIIENERELIISNNTLKIIDNSCRFFGSSYDGRFNGTKNLLGISRKSPIIIEESNKIIFFPTKSPRLASCDWISLNNIESYSKINNGVLIKFSCGKVIKLDISYAIFENQILRATRLESVLSKRIKYL